MELAKVASAQGAQASHASRAKLSSHPAAAETGDPAAGGGFWALLAALGDIADGSCENLQGETAIDNPLPAVKQCGDFVSSSPIDISAVGVWHGMFSSLQLPSSTASVWQYSNASTQIIDGPSALNGAALMDASPPVGPNLGEAAAVSQADSQGRAASSGSAHSDKLGFVASALQYSNAPTQNMDGPSTVKGAVLVDASPPVGPNLGGAASVALSGAQGFVAPQDNGLGEKLLGGIPQGLISETAKLDASADRKEEPLQRAFAGFGRAFSRMQSVSSQQVGSVGSSDVFSDYVTGRDSSARSLSVHGFLSAPLSSTGERVLMGGTAGTMMERSDAAQSSPTIGTGAVALHSDSVGAIAGSARAAESTAGGRSHGEGVGTPGAWSEGVSLQSPSDAGNFTDPTVSADPSVMGVEEQVTEQVAYWVNQKTQNAELTLQRDGHPVEVSVSLSGNEAHVSFRSDRQQTRELLDQSMAQLSDLLRSEGLVLSGMSVGTSARDSAGGGEAGQQRPREGARQAQVVSAVPAGATSLARGGGTSDRAVDIFV